MTREEAIYQLRGLMPSKDSIVSSWTKEHEEALSMAICALEGNPWHKASEELPKVDKYRKCIKVFARKGDDIFVAFYSTMAGFSLSSSFYTEYALSGVTHWMEIPEITED